MGSARGRCVQGPTAEAPGQAGVSEAEPRVAGAVSALQQAPRTGPRGQAARAAGLCQGWGWAAGTGLRAPSGGRRALCVPGRVWLLGGGPVVPTLPGGWSGAGAPLEACLSGTLGLREPREGLVNSEVLPASSGVVRGEVGWARFLLSPGTCHKQRAGIPLGQPTLGSGPGFQRQRLPRCFRAAGLVSPRDGEGWGGRQGH